MKALFYFFLANVVFLASCTGKIFVFDEAFVQQYHFIKIKNVKENQHNQKRSSTFLKISIKDKESNELIIGAEVYVNDVFKRENNFPYTVTLWEKSKPYKLKFAFVGYISKEIIFYPNLIKNYEIEVYLEPDTTPLHKSKK